MSEALRPDVLRVDVWSDVVCPWCYIGRRRFEDGVRRFRAAQHDAPDVEVVYHSFLLAPDTPEGFTGSVADFLADHKGMPPEHVRLMLDQVTTIAAGEGLDVDFDAAQHTTTLLAHELLHHALAAGRQPEMVERLFRAYFVEGRHVGRVDELVALAADVGLDPEETRAALTEHRFLDAVEQDFALARRYGIAGVPFTVVDGRYGISGAQDAAVFEDALRRAVADRAGSVS